MAAACSGLALLTGCATGQQPADVTPGTVVAPGSTAPSNPAKPISIDTPAGRLDSWCIGDNMRAFAQGGRIVSVVDTYHASNGPFDCNQATN